MCGIGGIVSNKLSNDRLIAVASQIGEALNHRGPDYSDFKTFPFDGVALTHKRLSIIDKSASSHQPMVSSCGRFTIVYNGEIYNYQSIKQKLKKRGVVFKTCSDTEVFLNSLIEYGAKRACLEANGMFAFALWDSKEKILTLGRDRFGQKPCYYGNFSHGFYFASELKALSCLEDIELEVDRQSLAQYFRLGYIPSNMSIYKGILKLEPGTILHFSSLNRKIITYKFWSALEESLDSNFIYQNRDPGDLEEELSIILNKTVKDCLVSDVPVGAFLSGGIDSATVVSIMSKVSSFRVKTFSVGFENSQYDESAKAEKIANYLGTEHHTLRVTGADALNVMPLIPKIYDEPFADPSKIPSLMLSKFASDSVKVALTGDGGDEMFAGYNRYLFAGRLTNFSKYPDFAKRLVAGFLSSLPLQTLDLFLNLLNQEKTAQVVEKLQRLSHAMQQNSIQDIYHTLVSNWPEVYDDKHLIRDLSTTNIIFEKASDIAPFRQMMIADTLTYLPDCILTKLDRASMAASLEARAPLLDHRLFKFAWCISDNMLLDNGTSKKLFRTVCQKQIPPSLLDGPKKGFSAPLGDWLRGDLRDWAESLLEAPDLENSGLNSSVICQEWSEIQSKRKHDLKLIWTVLMFRSWEELWLTK